MLTPYQLFFFYNMKVSGFEAANALMRDTDVEKSYKPHEVLAVREDEMQFKLGVEVNKKVMSVLPRFWTR